MKRTTATVDDDKTVVLNPFHKLNNVHNTILHIGVPTPWRGSPGADGDDDDDDSVYVYMGKREGPVLFFSVRFDLFIKNRPSDIRTYI